MNALIIPLFVGILFILVERIIPATELPKVPNWLFRAILFNLSQIAIILIAGSTWNLWLQDYSIFSIDTVGVVLGAFITYLVSTFIFYWWHRIRHESKFWWKFAHQIHHSASRLEILTSFYKHPLEILINSALSSIIVFPLMGCSKKQAALYTLFIAVGEMFYHWNIHTPRWLGHLFQRPESHRIHHQKDMHSKNYSDLPLWDKLFGTFSNPKNADKVKCGFVVKSELDIKAMLLGKEIDTKRKSEPLDFCPACFGCHKKYRCDKERPKNAG